MSSIAILLFAALLGNIGVTVSAVVITIAVLIFGEITFKNIAMDILSHWMDLEAVIMEASKEEITNTFTETRFFRLLVYEESIDKIVSVIVLGPETAEEN